MGKDSYPSPGGAESLIKEEAERNTPRHTVVKLTKIQDRI